MTTRLLLLACSLPLTLTLGCRGASVKLDDTSDAHSDADTDTDTDADTDTGTVVEGDLSVTPSSITLPVLFVGQQQSAEVTLSNVGGGTVSASLGFVGGWATSYTLDAYTTVLLAGETSVHTVTLTPTTWGDHSVGLIIDSDTGAHIEVPVSASAQEDNDGDGFGSVESGGADCNDADGAINPAATEIWYDGVDSDCAGDDDYDQDADGVQSPEAGGDDCNDTDATINPAITDAWYDGIDSDCGGNDDYDQDADNFVPDAYQGLPTAGVPGSGRLRGGDCDDANSAINPSAYDVWYDGVDSDCAGNDDYDQDGDTFDDPLGGGDDCDDTDATVYVGAPDTWYDGVDSDCAGDDDYDQDLDGVDYPSDCNDLDPTITGPVAETWNGNDDDCNGYVDDFVIGDVATGALYGYSSSMAIGDHGQLGIGDDVDGDGASDLLIGTRTSGDGYVWVVDGAVASRANGAVRDYESATISGDSGYYPIYSLNGPWGDTNSDGVTDFIIGGGYNGASYGRSYFFEGGVSLAGPISVAVADMRISGDSSSDDVNMGAVADLDGDGLADIVVGAYADNSNSDTRDNGSLSVYLAGTLAGELDLGDAADRIFGDNSYDYLGYSLTAADLDGDGYADIVAGAPGYDGVSTDGGAVYIVPGNASAAWSAGVGSAASGSVVGDSRELGLGTDTLPHPGDLDGDGALDLTFTSEADGTAWVFLGGAGLSADVHVSAADHILSGTAGDFGSMAVLDSDVDGDGADDLVVGADGDDTNGSNTGSVFVYTGASAWGATLSATDANASFWGTSSNGYLGTGGAGGADLDGDGADDLVLGSSGNDDAATDAGAVFIVPGW